MLLSDIKNWRQQREADCLVACTAMVLDYLGIHREYSWLTRILQTTEIGTPFRNVTKLHSAIGISVRTDINGSLAAFAAVLDLGLPVIVAVDSDDVGIWPYYHHHAVVVIGFDNDTVFINNPAANDAPQEVALETFLWAWSQRDYEYAIISLTESI